MNPAAEQPPPPPPQPLQPHRSSFSCDRHPEEQFTGFCPSCLCERLTSLGPSSSNGASSSSRRPSNASLAATSSTAANALKAIFRLPTSTSTTDPGNKNGFKSSAGNQKKNTSAAASAANASLFPELRRTKSFSASKNEGFSGVFEPQRHSCDVRGRSTLWSLFNQDDERKNGDHRLPVEVVEARNSVSSAVAAPVMESKEEDEEEEEEEEEEDEEQFIDVEDSGNEDEIRVSHASNHDIVRVSTSSNHDGIRISNYSNHDGARVSTSSNHDGIRVSNYSNHDGARVSTSSNHDGIRISNYSNHDATRVSNCSNHDAIRISTSSNLDGIRLSNYSYHDATRVSNCSNHDGIRVSNYSNLDELRIPKEATAAVGEGEIVEEENFNSEEVKTMKDHIDLDSQAKKKMGGNFTLWSAASVFSKKWQKWRQKQKKMKQPKENNDDAALPVDKPISRQFRETQSEVADYGFGRRSCDTDPRFSLDAGRISFDDPRYSFDEPRASWDGYLIGGSRGNSNFSRLPPILSVVEDSPVVHPARSDAHILVEQPRNSDCGNGDALPGGTEQTREYYSDSSSRRRKSLDRSSSIRKTAAAVVAEIDELKGASNAKVTPATVDLVGERELKHLNSVSLRDDCLETFELGFRDNGSVVGNGGNEEGKGLKKSRRWRAWNIWGLIHRRNGGNKDEDDERYKYNGRGNGVERSFSESWQELRRGESNGEVKIGGFNRRVFRSNSSVSSRNSYSMGGSLGNVRKPSVEVNGNGKKRREDFGLERNRSARYSPNHVDNGLLRFYLTPMRSNSRRGGLGKSKPNNNTHSITRTLLRMY